ncbi:MAG TPA: cytochrome c [Longimicrobiales bacterium]|nr:cytochrome c [Longimicrobiales bacterium]
MRNANAVRMALAALALASAAGCKPLDDAMFAIFGRSMRDSRAFDPYENVRPAPVGSVSFSSSNFPSGPNAVNLGEPDGADVVPFTQVDMVPIGTGNAVVQSLVNPVAMGDTAAMARGEVLYLRHCAVCHGVDGVGATAIIAGKHPTVAAYNLSGPIVAGYGDPYIYGMIRVGRGLMPAYGFRIPHYDRWKIVNYVRSLQLAAGNVAQAAPQGGN